MTLTEKIEKQEGRVYRAELKWEQARQAGQTRRALHWQLQYECECDQLDELYVEEMTAQCKLG